MASVDRAALQAALKERGLKGGNKSNAAILEILQYDRDTAQPPQAASGRGEKTYPDGATFLGALNAANQPSGFGTYTYADGGVHVGQFHKGRMHGSGVEYWPDGHHFLGIWHDGNPVQLNAGTVSPNLSAQSAAAAAAAASAVAAESVPYRAASGEVIVLVAVFAFLVAAVSWSLSSGHV